MTIAELQEDRVVEGVYAVRMKRKLRTKSGASYLALELVDPTGRVEARVWNDVELLDGRFAEGDAVRVLARVEKFRDRLQLDVRSLEVVGRRPADADAGSAARPGRAQRVSRLPRRRADAPRLARDRRGGAPRPRPRIVPGDTGGSPLLRRRPARAHGRRRDARARDGAAPPAAPQRPAARRRARARRRAHARARSGPGVLADCRGPPARPRAPRAPADRRARGRPERGAARRASPLLSRCTTMHGGRAPPRLRCCTTPTSSTQSRRLARSIDPAAPRARRQPCLGRRRLLRPADQPDGRRAAGADVGAGRRSRIARNRDGDSRRRDRPAGACSTRSERRSAACSGCTPTTAA